MFDQKYLIFIHLIFYTTLKINTILFITLERSTEWLTNHWMKSKVPRRRISIIPIERLRG